MIQECFWHHISLASTLKADRADSALLRWYTEATNTNITPSIGGALNGFKLHSAGSAVQCLPGIVWSAKIACPPGALPIHHPHAIPRQAEPNNTAAVPACA